VQRRDPAFAQSPQECVIKALHFRSILQAMDADDITFEDLMGGESGREAPPMTFEQLLADGFPHRGGLEGLAAIERMPDPGPRLAAVQRGYLQILKIQKH
jgi:hypothetical protein